MPDRLQMRNEPHLIGEKAVRRFDGLLPPEWVSRQLDAQDYGIDKIVELFQNSEPTGSYLLFQIKGQTVLKRDANDDIVFDFSVRTIRYAELFSSPFILCVCQTEGTEEVFFVWIQEYVKVVLDIEERSQPWRDQGTVCIKIPSRNRLPGSEGKLKGIAGYPKRINSLVKLMPLFLHIRYVITEVEYHRKKFSSFQSRDDLMDGLENCIHEILALEGLYGDPNWPWANFAGKRKLRLMLRVIERFQQGPPYQVPDWVAVGVMSHKTVPPQPHEFEDEFFRQLTILQTDLEMVFQVFTDAKIRAREIQHSDLIEY